MRRTDAIIIGGGQAGLAMSRCLSDLSIDHVVLERGSVAQRWRSERWDSLRLLTPNWQSRLPGWRYGGANPDGYMTVAELIEYLERYARASAAPVEHDTTVLEVRPDGDGYRVATTRGSWWADSVVIATGHNDVPRRPAFAADLSRDLFQIDPARYRNPGSLPDGGVLVVGASATGIQLAEELRASGRPVTLAVGRHTRLPRVYRGADIMWWLDASGALDRPVRSPEDADQPSLQLIGSPERRSIDLLSLHRRGVRIAGRALGAGGHVVRLADDLAASTAAADDKLDRVLGRIDRYIAERPDCAQLPGPQRPPRWRPPRAPQRLDLRAEGITSVLWATGFSRAYPWLRVPVLDGRGEIRHRGGVTPAAGLYALGLQYMRRPKSSFIDGVGDDARVLAAHICSRLHGVSRAAA